MNANQSINLRLSPEYIMGGYTGVDNIFICEYLKTLDELQVKVYVYGLYLAHTGIPTSVESLCVHFSASADEILNCLDRLSDEGLIDLCSQSPLEILYRPLLTTYTKPRKIKAGKYDDFNKQLQGIISGRMLTPNDFTECYNVLELYHIEPSAFILIASYCASIKDKSISTKYVLQTAKNFAYKKITTLKAVEDQLERYSLESSFMALVVKKLGLKRSVELEDSQFVQKWKELGYDEKAILTSASTVKGTGASMRKLDGLITELYSFKKFSQNEILDFAENKANMKTLAIKVNKALSVYYESLDAEINTYIMKWLALGFSDEMLVTIADFCFVNSVRTLKGMEDILQKLTKKGIITLESFSAYTYRLSEKDKEINELLEILGLDRKVNAYDRKNYLNFESLGFTKDMILYAAELSRAASSPYPYMNSVLINWKNNNVFRKEEVSALTQTTAKPMTSKAKESIPNKFTKEQLASVYTALDDIEF